MFWQAKFLRKVLSILLALMFTAMPVLYAVAEAPAATETTDAVVLDTPQPTATADPTAVPTAEPTAEPTDAPTSEPTLAPTVEPTAEPTAELTESPSVTATPVATAPAGDTASPQPTETVAPSVEPLMAKAYKLETPVFSISILSEYTVKLTWSAVKYAGSYDILMSTNPYDSYSVVGNTTALSATVTNAALNGQVCYFKMQAKRGASSSAVDGDISGFRTAMGLAKPVVSSVSEAFGSGNVTVTWGAVSNANGYRVLRSSSPSSGFAVVATITDGATSAKIGKTQTGLIQYYKVQAVRQYSSTATYYGASSAAAASFRLTIGADPVITSVQTLGASGIQINWQGTANADGYYIYRATTGGAKYIATVLPAYSAANTYNYVDKNPVKNADNTYVIKAFNSFYTTALSNRLMAHYVALDRPVRVTANYVGASRAYLQWTPVTGASGYHIYKNGTTAADKIAELSDTFYYDATLAAGEVATYYVCAIKVSVSGGVEQTFEGPFCTMQTSVYAPTALTTAIAGSATSAQLTWKMSAYPGSETGFSIYRSNFATHGFQVIYTGTVASSGGVYTYVDSTTSAGQAYYYKLLAYRNNGGATRCSGYSSIATFMSLSATTPKSIVPTGSTSATITWDKVFGAIGYYVYRGDSASSYVHIGYIEGNSFTDNGLITGQTYYYRIRPRGLINGTVYQGPLSEARPFVFMIAPDISITATTTDSATLSWTSVQGATSYRVYYATTAGSSSPTVVETSGTSLTINGLTAGQVYFFSVRGIVRRSYTPAFDHTYGLRSGEVNCLMTNVPVMTEVVPYQTNGINLSWTASGSSVVDGYAIYRSSYRDYGYSFITDAQNVLSYTDTGLSAGYYYYKVRTFKVVNGIRYYSAYTAPMGARVLAKPTVLGAYGTVDRTSIVIAWNAVTDASGYNIYRLTGSGVYTKIGETTGTRYEDGKSGGALTPGSSYSYVVEPYQIVNFSRMTGTQSTAVSATTAAWPDWTAANMQTPHNYAANSTYSYTYSIPGANYLRLTFSTNTRTEANADFIYIYNAAGTMVGQFSGTQLQGQTITVTGSSATVTLVSNASVQYWGFALTNITPMLTMAD
ncbi:MAG: fibronectin type III domain-containing protein [Candidatus Limiplasma sp.]|nr:fibronectin type III domain-containing protein [Candidatus Limiplasma sp.]MEA5145564.1 fibronectin type III domain-containing protein [Candidatus Limiplasma sp.]